MSIYRNIHCQIWNDDKFPFLSDDCQLVFFHLMTTPLSTPIGIFKAPIEGLAAEKRWPLPRYKKAFAEGLAKGFWKYDERFYVLVFNNYFKWNKPENPNVLRGWIKHFDMIPNASPLKAEAIKNLNTFAEGWGKPFGNVCLNLSSGFAKQEQEQEQEQEQKTTPQAGAFVLPDWIPLETWQEFQKVRKKKKAACTDYAHKLIVNELIRLRDLGNDPVAVINKSIKGGWADVYPLKEGDNGYGTHRNSGKPAIKGASDFSNV